MFKNKRLIKWVFLLFSMNSLAAKLCGQGTTEKIYPSRSEKISPIIKSAFNKKDTALCVERKQGGNSQMVNGFQVFNGSMDGNRQVDPQIAVGGGYVLHGTNSGLVIYDKKGKFINGVSQKCFNDGIDPKMFFDAHNKVFVFDLWWYYDKPKVKPVNIAVTKTADPNGAWNIYPVAASSGVDGGGIGYSKKWIGYSFPGGEERSFILRTQEAKAGTAATVYHFKGSLGHPVFVQDKTDDLYFFDIERNNFVIRKVSEDENGQPYAMIVTSFTHNLQYVNQPPQSAQKGTSQKVSSGDRNPKNLVLQGGYLWFSQAVNCNGRAAVQWHQVDIAGSKIVQTGLIKSDTTNYIQTTIAVNKKNDVLIGFQEVNENSFISPRFAYRKSGDAPGTVKRIISAGEGKGAADGVAWGDYSGSMIDGDNGKDLWTIQSIANEKGRGETVIIKVPYKKLKK